MSLIRAGVYFGLASLEYERALMPLTMAWRIRAAQLLPCSPNFSSNSVRKRLNLVSQAESVLQAEYLLSISFLMMFNMLVGKLVFRSFVSRTLRKPSVKERTEVARSLPRLWEGFYIYDRDA